MKFIKKGFKWLFYVLLIPLCYLLISLILTSITVDRKKTNLESNKLIYLNTNGVHLDVVIPKAYLDDSFLAGIKHQKGDNYLSFGWGDKNFYLNTPTWDDLRFSNAFNAMFLESETLIHVNRHRNIRSNWMALKINKIELQKLKAYISNTFKIDKNKSKLIIPNKGYSTKDDFYLAKGSYSCFKTCNTWVNQGFKESGLKSCLWTPFDFGLMGKYE